MANDKNCCDSLDKCLPSLLSALGHPASTGEAGSGTGSSNETLKKAFSKR